MDNDNKITEESKNNIHQEVMLFLGDELNSIHGTTGNQTYQIEKEFAKTKQHRSFFALLVLSACCVAVIGIAFLLHRVISQKNQEISVSLTEFNDLNLRTLLDTVASAQTNYDNAVKNKVQVQSDMETQLRNASEAYENDIFVINSMNLKYKTVYNDKVAAAKKKYDDTVKLIHKEFDEKLVAVDAEVAEYKSQLAEFDTSKIETARNQEKALDSERQLRELETKKLTDKYEKRIADLELTLQNQQKKSTEEIRKAVAQVSKQYQHEIDLLDPTIKDTEAFEIIEDAKSLETPDFDGAALLVDNSVVSQKVSSFVENYQEIYNNFKYLDDVVASIPQKNSIPKYVSSARILVNDMGEAFIDTTVSFYEETEKLNKQISDISETLENERIIHKENLEKQQELLKNQQDLYEESITNILTLAKTNAIILSGTDYENIKVFVAPKARYLITENGADGEIKLTKAIKGKILRQEDDSFIFEISPDKDGFLPEVDFSLLVPGTSVKIISK